MCIKTQELKVKISTLYTIVVIFKYVYYNIYCRVMYLYKWKDNDNQIIAQMYRDDA